MMGNNSRNKLENDESSGSPLQINLNPAYKEHLTSYQRACSEDPTLQSFDSALRERTNRVINKLVSDVELESLSFDSLREVIQCLFNMNQDVLKVILHYKEDIWKDQDLYSFVNMYLQSIETTQSFCSELGNCLNCARQRQEIIQFAVEQFEEIPLNRNNVKEKYEKTLGELKRFKSARDPFAEGFFYYFSSITRRHIMMLEELHTLKKNLVKNIKLWRIVSNMVFVTGFIAVLIFRAVAAPPVVAAIADALAVPVGSAGEWCNSLWTKFENVVRGQKQITTWSWVEACYISVKEMDNISVLLSKLEVEIEYLLKKAEFSVTKQKVVRLAIDEIEEGVIVFTETIEEFRVRADKYCRNMTTARAVILHMSIGIGYPSGSAKEEGTR